ncbi:MAG TPA: transglycosylase family protein [Nocardioidaceae bacterium]
MRSKIALLTKSKAALAVLVGAVVMAVGATTAGYAAMSKTVTLSLDGRTEQVHTLDDTVGEVLESEGVSVDTHDVVAPGLDSQVSDGSRIAVRYGRPLDVTIDGQDKRYWVTATDVATALDQLGLRLAGADLSTSRSAPIGRSGLDLKVVTPKTLTYIVGSGKKHTGKVPAMTVEEALKELGVKVDKDDKVQPGLGATVEDGDKIVVTKFQTVTRKVEESIDHGTVQRSDSSLYRGQTRTVRSGRDGSREVVYRITYKNGHVVSRKALRSELVRKPVAAVVKVGTKSRPAPAPTTNYASGSTVWDQLAQCESGGNWAANTGNGYYGGLQFNLSTWHSYGGTGYPNEASRETQIAIAEKVRAANGGYGAWPACAAELGLPT